MTNPQPTFCKEKKMTKPEKTDHDNRKHNVYGGLKHEYSWGQGGRPAFFDLPKVRWYKRVWSNIYLWFHLNRFIHIFFPIDHVAETNDMCDRLEAYKLNNKSKETNND
jgi:hypothetical protein